MGSRARHSTDRKATSRPARQGKAGIGRSKPPGTPRPNFDLILGEISDALSIMATATGALVGAQEATGTVNATTVSHAIITLEHGVSRLKKGYDTLDVALRQVRP
jgi:hypothetical protein